MGEVFWLLFLSTPSALCAPFGSSVKLGSLTLIGHRMTSSHSSKDPIRPLSQGDKEGDCFFISFLHPCLRSQSALLAFPISFLPLRQGGEEGLQKKQ